jgi:hypothetical protein
MKLKADSFVHLGCPAALGVNLQPTSDSILPIDDSVWDQGVRFIPLIFSGQGTLPQWTMANGNRNCRVPNSTALLPA